MRLPLPSSSSKLRALTCVMRSVIVLPSVHVDGRDDPHFGRIRWDLSWEPTVADFFPESACVLCCYFLASIFDFLLTIRVGSRPV